MPINYSKHLQISMKNHADINEKWVQERIADDPASLGLGDLILKDIERIQPGAGRLDLLFQDPEENIRYEVEIQLGKTDESHIIRSIEYWDLEKRRYPQYDHIAVLIAEDITSRFLNIISLFNGVIPLVAIKMSLVQIQNQFTLIFTTVLDQRVGFSTADEEAQEVTDRAYWEKKGTKFTVAMADELVELLKKIDPEIEPKYNKFYIGLARNAKPFNFVIFRPKKQAIRVELRLQKSDEIEEKLENAGVEVMEYSSRDRRYRIRLSKGDITKHQALLNELFMLSYKEFSGNPDD